MDAAEEAELPRWKEGALLVGGKSSLVLGSAAVSRCWQGCGSCALLRAAPQQQQKPSGARVALATAVAMCTRSLFCLNLNAGVLLEHRFPPFFPRVLFLLLLGGGKRGRVLFALRKLVRERFSCTCSSAATTTRFQLKRIAPLCAPASVWPGGWGGWLGGAAPPTGGCR